MLSLSLGPGVEWRCPAPKVLISSCHWGAGAAAIKASLPVSQVIGRFIGLETQFEQFPPGVCVSVMELQGKVFSSLAHREIVGERGGRTPAEKAV